LSKLRIISGGQTGVDRAALDAARELGLPIGGFVPRDRWTEEGPLAAQYEGMIETEEAGPSVRTRRNVELADATLIITSGACEGGTLLTLRKARACGKPHLVVDLAAIAADEAVEAIRASLAGVTPATLNVAGPRASKNSEIYDKAKAIMLQVFTQQT
jgi:hypothetical protein